MTLKHSLFGSEVCSSRWSVSYGGGQHHHAVGVVRDQGWPQNHSLAISWPYPGHLLAPLVSDQLREANVIGGLSQIFALHPSLHYHAVQCTTYQ